MGKSYQTISEMKINKAIALIFFPKVNKGTTPDNKVWLQNIEKRNCFFGHKIIHRSKQKDSNDHL